MLKGSEEWFALSLNSYLFTLQARYSELNFQGKKKQSHEKLSSGVNERSGTIRGQWRQSLITRGTSLKGVVNFLLGFAINIYVYTLRSAANVEVKILLAEATDSGVSDNGGIWLLIRSPVQPEKM